MKMRKTDDATIKRMPASKKAAINDAIRIISLKKLSLLIQRRIFEYPAHSALARRRKINEAE